MILVYLILGFHNYSLKDFLYFSAYMYLTLVLKQAYLQLSFIQLKIRFIYKYIALIVRIFQKSQYQHTMESQSSPLHAVSEAKVLKIATLNYCGIMNNPFEFYNSSFIDQFKEISETFKRTAHDYGKGAEGNKFNWGMGKVETKFRDERYSPSFHLNVGFKGGKFLDQKQFYEEWDKGYESMSSKSGLKFDEKNLQSARLYDFIFFHALLRYVYKSEEKFDQLIKDKDPAVYVKTLEKFYEASYLDDNKKLEKVKDNLFKIEADVLFLQEYSPLLLKYIQQIEHYYCRVDPSEDTLIIIKKSSFGKIIETQAVLSKEEIESINWNEKTAILIVDNIILLCAHTSSKKEKNLKQLEDLKASLIKLKKAHLDYHIILGGDLNSFLRPVPQFSSYFSMYPQDEKDITTVKKRTYAQGQYEKSDVENVESKDKIISDLTIVSESGTVTYIDNVTKANPASFVPTDDHPFDHFVVSCKVIVSVK